jgi:hypothetical protein
MILTRQMPREEMSMFGFVAAATLPVTPNCAIDAYQVASAIHAITIPLVGSRKARKLIATVSARPGEDLRYCACLVDALVWRLDDECLSAVSTTNPDIKRQLSQVELVNRKAQDRELQWLRDDPPDWVRSMIQEWGMDGVVLRLSELLRVRNAVPEATCVELSRAVAVDTSLVRSNLSRSTEGAERAATLQFKGWLRLGCPANYAEFKDPH